MDENLIKPGKCKDLELYVECELRSFGKDVKIGEAVVLVCDHWF